MPFNVALIGALVKIAVVVGYTDWIVDARAKFKAGDTLGDGSEWLSPVDDEIQYGEDDGRHDSKRKPA